MLRAMRIRKRVRVGKFFKKLKGASKLLKALCRKLIPAAQAPPPPPTTTHDNLAFMTCIIKVNPSRPGWQKAVLSLLRNCRGSRCKMDQNGVVELSGIADPNRVLKKLGRHKRVELQWFQFGQCSSYLFMPPSKKEDRPVKEEEEEEERRHTPFPHQTQYPSAYPLPYPPPPQQQHLTRYLPY